MDTLRFVRRALRAQIPMCWQRMGRCASKHNWPITIYLTTGAWFMNCWLLVGRRWRKRRQRPLVMDMCKCHTKSQWVPVTLTDSSVYERECVDKTGRMPTTRVNTLKLTDPFGWSRWPSRPIEHIIGSRVNRFVKNASWNEKKPCIPQNTILPYQHPISTKHKPYMSNRTKWPWLTLHICICLKMKKRIYTIRVIFLHIRPISNKLYHNVLFLCYI